MTSSAGNSMRGQMEGIKDRIFGAIFASACGNSLGGSCIGLNRKEILVSTGFSSLPDFIPGLSRSHLPEHKSGALLSDSYLSMAVGESLIRRAGHYDASDMKDELKRLIESPEFLASRPNALCLSTMRCVIDSNQSGLQCFNLPDVSTAARAFICGCLPGQPKTDDVLELAKAQCQSAYSDNSVMAAACVIADSVSFFIRGGKIDTESEVRAYVQRQLIVASAVDQGFADAWDGIAPDLDYSKPAAELPYSLINVQPNITELVPTAVGIFLIFRHNLEHALSAAALSGGDTDTVSHLVGAFAGAYHGAKVIPQRWMETIEHRDRLEKIADGLSKFWDD